MSQTEFRNALLDPGLPVPRGMTDPKGRLDARRFGVYRNNVTVGLTEALRASFPVVRALVGEEFFAMMAREHLRSHPPKSPLMMFYGDDMPDFLARFAPVSHLGYLPDVARLELALRHSYHAADSKPIDPGILQQMPMETLLAARLRLAPTVRVIRSEWPVHTIWMANTLGTPAPTSAVAEDVLVLRPDFDPEPKLLPEGAAGFILELQSGAAFGTAFETAGEFDLTAVLGLLLSGGAITEVLSGDTE